MILADTDVLIDYLAGIEPVSNQIAAYISADLLKTSTINCFELLSGVRDGKRGDRVRRLVQLLPVVSLDRASAEQAATIRQRLECSGVPIGMGDSLIAGIALANGLPLFTRNRRHFERIDGLHLVDPE